MSTSTRHVPVLRDRVIALLAPALEAPGAVLVDATLGLGGHAEHALASFPGLHLVGLDRDPEALRRSLDVFSVAASGVPDVDPDGAELRIDGHPEAIAEALLAYAELGFDEVRVDLRAGDMSRSDAIRWMEPVVRLVHAG